MSRPHEKLEGWKKGIGVVTEIYALTKRFPDSEKFGIVSQLRRAAVSVPTNVAEGAARHNDREFLQFLYISSGSLSEIDTLLTISKELNYMIEGQYGKLKEQAGEVSAMLQGIMTKLTEKTK